MNRIIYIIIFGLFFIQCEDSKNTSVSANDLSGKYIHLEAEKIDLFVPEDIKMFSMDEYAAYVNTIKDKKKQEIQRARYLDLKHGSQGNYYILGTDDHKTSITFHALPYMEISQSLSQMILKGLSKKHKAFGNVIGYESSFSHANIIKKDDGSIFRAVFLYKSQSTLINTETTIYTYVYLVSRKGKTFMLDIKSRKETDFDSYVQKIKL